MTIYNHDRTLALTDAERSEDVKESEVLRKQGGGAAVHKTGKDTYAVGIDLTYATGQTALGWDGKTPVPHTAETVLGHELLGHVASDEKDKSDWFTDNHKNEKKAREYENKHLRYPAGLPLRSTDPEKKRPK